MNPTPAAPPPVIPPPWLEDRRPGAPADPLVPASVVRGFPHARLGDVERTWGPARDALAAAARAAGYELENGHWDWRNKVRFYRPGHHCLVAVECEGDVQGLMAVQTSLRPSQLSPGHWILYVDFVEAAPWNRREPPRRTTPAIQEPRFGGVGTLLIGEAIRLSVGPSANGRVGLHALPSAEGFYANHCGMTRVGPDPDYHDLVYFEYPDGVAAAWLAQVGLSA